MEGFERKVESAFQDVWLESKACLCASYLLINPKTCLWIIPKLYMSVRTGACQFSLGFMRVSTEAFKFELLSLLSPRLRLLLVLFPDTHPLTSNKPFFPMCPNLSLYCTQSNNSPSPCLLMPHLNSFRFIWTQASHWTWPVKPRKNRHPN